jgi:phosphocarrier protein FPr/phosphocarrier protein
MARLILLAPLAGWSAPLEEVPDAVFGQRMLGDGVAIDPTGSILHAPCDGEIISAPASLHAIALRASNGAEVLVHVGIETVGLGGRGFTSRVRKGDRVRAGDALLEIDLALLARTAKSLITPVILTNGEHFRIAAPRLARTVAVGDPLFEIDGIAAVADAVVPGATQIASERVIARQAHGIHARPAALIARAAKAVAAEIEVRAHGRTANARSAVALMALGIRQGDEVVIVGAGEGAAAAIAEIARMISTPDKPAARPLPPPVVQATRITANTHDTSLFRGVIASRGLALGGAAWLKSDDVTVIEPGQGIAVEAGAFERAREAVRARLSPLAKEASPTARELIAAHIEILEDPELLGAARALISTGKSAAFAWRSALRQAADALRATGDARLAERVDDLDDLERQVITVLGGSDSVARAALPPGTILLARDMSPSQLIELEGGKPAGIVLEAGGPTSHVAVLAASLGIPMLVAVGSKLKEIRAGTTLALDADAGSLRVAPDVAQRADFEYATAARRERLRRELEAARGDCHAASGERIEVFANLGSVADARIAVAHGAEGCGLLRSEFLFLDRASAPDEREQRETYQRVARVLEGRPLVIRTLDVGGDKPLSYLPLPAEENPALGLRGIRVSLWRPELLRTQLRAILSVEPAGQCRILLPMINDVEELRRVRAVLDELIAELRVERPQLGVMIETPAAAMMSDALAREADFLSIGTNDLSQYALAIDRGNAELAARIDAAHPAVLRLIAHVAAAAARHSRIAAVCGGLASDPAAAPLLLGLGINELSVVPAQIPHIKEVVRSRTLGECRALAERALALDSAADVRELLAKQAGAVSGVQS